MTMSFIFGRINGHRCSVDAFLHRFHVFVRHINLMTVDWMRISVGCSQIEPEIENQLIITNIFTWFKPNGNAPNMCSHFSVPQCDRMSHKHYGFGYVLDSSSRSQVEPTCNGYSLYLNLVIGSRNCYFCRSPIIYNL